MRDYQAASLALSGRSNCSEVSGLHSLHGVSDDCAVGFDGVLLGSSESFHGLVEGFSGLGVVASGNLAEVVHDLADVTGFGLGLFGSIVVHGSFVVGVFSVLLLFHGSLGVGNGLSEFSLGRVETVVSSMGPVDGLSPSGGPHGDDSSGMGGFSSPGDSHASSVHPDSSGFVHSFVGTSVVLTGFFVVSGSLSGSHDGFLVPSVPCADPLGLSGSPVLSFEVLDGLVSTAGNIGKVLFDEFGSGGHGFFEVSLTVEEGEVTEVTSGGDGSESADGSDFAEHVVN